MVRRRIEAYFKSENDAESAKAALQQLHVSDLIVDDIPESGYKVTFVPFAQSGLSWGVAAPIDIKPGEKKTEDITHVLEGEVNAEEFDKALDILSEKDGYMKGE